MKMIEVDEELYHYIASQTQQIGESASSILRRLLLTDAAPVAVVEPIRSNTELETLIQLVNSNDFSNEKKQVSRFLLILMALYQCNNELFALATSSLHGSKRRYLAEDEQTLLQSGNATKPKQIPDTPYWVVTNNNAARKIYIIESIMQSMNIAQDIIELVKTKFVTK